MNCKSCNQAVDLRSTVACSRCESNIHKECAIMYDGAHVCDVCFTLGFEEPESRFGEFEMPEFIRRTHIETYRTCPYKFYLEVIKDNPMPPNCYTQVGSDLHEIFEEVLKTGKPETPQEALQYYEETYWNHYDDELFKMRSKEDMYDRAVSSIGKFYATLPEVNNVYAVEETIFFEVGANLPKVRITMDLVTRDENGELEMHDWKTGRVMVGQKLSSDLQAPLYIYAVQQHFKKPVKRFTFHYLQEGKKRVYERSPINPEMFTCTVGKREYHINLSDAIREVKRIFGRIRKGDFNVPSDTRKMYFPCKMCHLREQGLCEGAESESWRQMTY